MDSLNPFGQAFRSNLANVAAARQAFLEYNAKNECFHITGTGKFITGAYEQLRNASENAEQHLLLQRAIRRFLKRFYLTNGDRVNDDVGIELITELTLAGYVKNDSVPVSTVKLITKLIAEYTAARDTIKRKVSFQRLNIYTIDPLSVEISEILSPRYEVAAITDLAYHYFITNLQIKGYWKKKPADYTEALFVAIYSTILRADEQGIRHEYLRRFKVKPGHADFLQRNQQVDALLKSPTADKLQKIVDRQGSPFRILFQMVSSDQFDVSKLLLTRTAFLTNFEVAVKAHYESLDSSINRGVVRSIIFLIITKFLLGIAVELPYDYMILGYIQWLPLVINLLFPPIYMFILRFTMYMPDQANTTALTAEIDRILFQTPSKLIVRPPRKFGLGYKLFYAFVVLAVFYGAGAALVSLGFNWVQLIIFYVFVSGASFLGFRLNRLIRDIEIIASHQNIVTIVRDFLYMPFVIVGQWVTEKYQKIHIVSRLLDMFVELPLKSILYMIRQWTNFISGEKDRL
ncbi:hypothetical protein FWF93_02635 [Candidatus Saccharibacteria bacterium]|nr:hypothetical protein [Candidatus Saccharibacteria bacterium]